MLPILIGSRALEYYGYQNNSQKEYDLVVNLDVAHKLSSVANKKDKFSLWFGDQKVDLFVVNKNATSDHHLFYGLNNLDCNRTIICDNIEVIIPPLQILYAIKKSHIHAILPFTHDAQINKKIWLHHIEMFLWMKQKNIIGDTVDYIISKNSTSSFFENLICVIHAKRLDETNKKPHVRVSDNTLYCVVQLLKNKTDLNKISQLLP